MYIYIIENDVTDLVYVGQTEKTLENRLCHHFGNAKSGKTLFAKVLRSIGTEHFTIRLLEEVSEDLINEREMFWVNFYKNTKGVYNTKFSCGKSGGDTLSHHPHREDILKKISDSVKGGKNPNAKPVYSINVITGDKEYFTSVKECQDFYGIERNDIVIRRCNGKIKKPYNDLMFEYAQQQECID